MNGTPGKQMYEEYLTASDRIQDAILAVNLITLNGRDYYTQGPQAFEGARVHRNEMRRKLESVYDDLCIIADGIMAQL